MSPNSDNIKFVDTPMLRRALDAWNTDFKTVAQKYPLKQTPFFGESTR